VILERRLQVAASTVLFFCISAVATHASPATDFDKLLDEHWANATQEQVFFRTDPDAWRMNGKLAEFTQDARLRRQRFNDTVLERLAAIDPQHLDTERRMSYRLFLYERLAEKESHTQPDRLFPITALFGYHSYFVAAPANMAFLNLANYEQYLVSLADFPRYNREHIELMREAVSRAYTQHCDAMQGVRQSIAELIVDDPASSPLYAPFEKVPQTVSAKRQEELRKQGKSLIDEAVLPGFRELLQFYDTEYMPNCRKEAGIGSLEGGDAYYAWLIRYFTTTDLTAQEIHELGKSELARIRREMEAIMADLEFAGNFSAFIDYLRREPRFYAKDVPELLGRAALIAKTAEGELPRFFTLLPRGTYSIRANPGRGSYYMPSSGDGRTAGTYFVGTARLDSEPLYMLEALTLHEGVPGHHLQGALAMELELPEFRKTVYHSAFGEGWGLYSERLGKEMGFYADPYSDFGRLSYEAWRAGRLVVDTGIHAFGWTREDAVQFLLQNASLGEHEVRSEVDRYITWPAQALSYKIGEIRIRALRERAERALGTDFDIRRFHDTVIGSGSLPIDVLDELVNEWIANELRDAGG
jgi:uncharacterized protein (DUF885 family)